VRSATGRVALRTNSGGRRPRGPRFPPSRKAERWTATRMSIVSASDRRLAGRRDCPASPSGCSERPCAVGNTTRRLSLPRDSGTRLSASTARVGERSWRHPDSSHADTASPALRPSSGLGLRLRRRALPWRVAAQCAEGRGERAGRIGVDADGQASPALPAHEATRLAPYDLCRGGHRSILSSGESGSCSPCEAMFASRKGGSAGVSAQGARRLDACEDLVAAAVRHARSSCQSPGVRACYRRLAARRASPSGSNESGGRRPSVSLSLWSRARAYRVASSAEAYVLLPAAPQPRSQSQRIVLPAAENRQRCPSSVHQVMLPA
jgi:hypothetical protein